MVHTTNAMDNGVEVDGSRLPVRVLHRGAVSIIQSC
jgi:hypothetical protein